MIRICAGKNRKNDTNHKNAEIDEISSFVA
jgi:hypothetical protein